MSHGYGSTVALTDVSFALTPGVTALLGVNGAGKTTLLNVLSGGMRPTSGDLEIVGMSPFSRHSRRGALKSVALMPQLAEFPRNLSVLETVEYLAWLKGLSSSQARASAVRAVEAVGLANRASSRIKQLSGGMLRRVALAQALASDPKVLLLDEPSTGLDPAQRRQMLDLLADLTGTVLMSSHIVEDVESLASRALVLHEGSLRFDGTLDDLTALGAGRPGGSRTSSSALERGFLALVDGAKS